jgi:two-component system chemotaxis response regulator CheY
MVREWLYVWHIICHTGRTMRSKKTNIPSMSSQEWDKRERLSLLKVLVADRDHRTASLVQRVLFSFGFRTLDVTTSGESVLSLLRSRPYDIIITEWNMQPVDGLALVNAIRTAKDDQRIPRDIPIIMLTARADKDSVIAARDAGITEFLAKPFSAHTLSHRIIQIVDNPRVFVESTTYTGPDRRRRGNPPPGVLERRGTGNSRLSAPNESLKLLLGGSSAAEILNDWAIAAAQAHLMEAEDSFIEWAREDIAKLEIAFRELRADPGNILALNDLIDCAYAIKSQAGVFGYPLGGEVAGLLLNYLDQRRSISPERLIVLEKHIDTVRLIFRDNIKDTGQTIALDMLQSLKKLIYKLG